MADHPQTRAQDVIPSPPPASKLRLTFETLKYGLFQDNVGGPRAAEQEACPVTTSRQIGRCSARRCLENHPLRAVRMRARRRCCANGSTQLVHDSRRVGPLVPGQGDECFQECFC
jgi:hypothetical protein